MKVILIAAISADGKIAERPGQSSLDWTSRADLKFFVRKTKEIGTLVLGRTTFETIAHPLKERRMIVMTNRPLAVAGVESTQESASALVQRLCAEGCPALAVCGGAQVYSQFLTAGLVHEVFLTVEPVLFGNGVPLGQGFDRVNLQLVNHQPLGEEAILLHYVVLPYLPRGRRLRYVAAEHPQMQAARELIALSGCVKQQVGAVLVKEGIVIGRGANGFARGHADGQVCQRQELGCKTGEGYEHCPNCVAAGHAEAVVIAAAQAAGHDPAGADLYLWGHWWACEPCWSKIETAGIRDVYLAEGAYKKFIYNSA